jgi:hypothetical protein
MGRPPVARSPASRSAVRKLGDLFAGAAGDVPSERADIAIATGKPKVVTRSSRLMVAGPAALSRESCRSDVIFQSIEE